MQGVSCSPFQPLKPLLKIFLISETHFGLCFLLYLPDPDLCSPQQLSPVLRNFLFAQIHFSLLGADLQAVEGSQAFLEFGIGFPGLAISQLAPPSLVIEPHSLWGSIGGAAVPASPCPAPRAASL